MIPRGKHHRYTYGLCTELRRGEINDARNWVGSVSAEMNKLMLRVLGNEVKVMQLTKSKLQLTPGAV